MKVSDLIIKALEKEGVTHVFGLPGEETEDLLFSLANSSITFVPTRHEQGAAFMANVWGRLTGKAGVCLATLGHGATNLITGLAELRSQLQEAITSQELCIVEIKVDPSKNQELNKKLSQKICPVLML